jgi:hypothetical protein
MRLVYNKKIPINLRTIHIENEKMLLLLLVHLCPYSTYMIIEMENLIFFVSGGTHLIDYLVEHCEKIIVALEWSRVSHAYTLWLPLHWNTVNF